VYGKENARRRPHS